MGFGHGMLGMEHQGTKCMGVKTLGDRADTCFACRPGFRRSQHGAPRIRSRSRTRAAPDRVAGRPPNRGGGWVCQGRTCRGRARLALCPRASTGASGIEGLHTLLSQKGPALRIVLGLGLGLAHACGARTFGRRGRLLYFHVSVDFLGPGDAAFADRREISTEGGNDSSRAAGLTQHTPAAGAVPAPQCDTKGLPA